jgi:DNA polymerase-3 subunit gamma/tau
MEPYVVSFRKYRPNTFESVVGQEHVTQTLKNAILNNQLSQAYLFTGPRGVGKTTCARILAKVMNMENPVEAVNDGSYATVDLDISMNIFELDAASRNSVEDIRELIEQVRYVPQSGKKIYIIDEVHMLSNAAFNAFLKTLEEPPPYAIFILATTDKHKVLPTILSRCQIFDFKRIQTSDITHHLEWVCTQEGVKFEKEGLHIVAQKADGGLRDALSTLDQLIALTEGNLTYSNVVKSLNLIDHEQFFAACDSFLQQDVSALLNQYDQITATGFDGTQFIAGLADHFRNLLLSRDAKTVHLVEGSEALNQRYLEQSKKFNSSYLLSALDQINRTETTARNVKNQRLHFELCLMRLAMLPSAQRLSILSEDEKKN